MGVAPGGKQDKITGLNGGQPLGGAHLGRARHHKHRFFGEVVFVKGKRLFSGGQFPQPATQGLAPEALSTLTKGPAVDAVTPFHGFGANQFHGARRYGTLMTLLSGVKTHGEFMLKRTVPATHMSLRLAMVSD
jgi:hypothetical protein